MWGVGGGGGGVGRFVFVLSGGGGAGGGKGSRCINVSRWRARDVLEEQMVCILFALHRAFKEAGGHFAWLSVERQSFSRRGDAWCVYLYLYCIGHLRCGVGGGGGDTLCMSLDGAPEVFPRSGDGVYNYLHCIGHLRRKERETLHDPLCRARGFLQKEMVCILVLHQASKGREEGGGHFAWLSVTRQ